MTIVSKCVGVILLAACIIAAVGFPARAVDWPINKRDLKSIKEWQSAIKKNDKAWVIKNSAPPLELSTCSNDKEVTRGIGDEVKPNWIADYDTVMTAEVKNAILLAKPKDLIKDYQGISIRKGNLVIWFFGDTNYENDVPFDGYQLESITKWPQATCAGVSLDPHLNVGPLPTTILGAWAEGGACNEVEKRMVLATNTAKFGTHEPEKVINLRHAGPRGAWRSFDLGEGDAANFVYGPYDDFQTIEVLVGWSSQDDNDTKPYKRCSMSTGN